MTYVSAMARIEAGGVEGLLSSALLCQVCCADSLLLLLMFLRRAPRLFPLLLPRAFDAKAAFVTAIDALHAIAKHDECSVDDPAFLCHVPLCLCPTRPLFARVEEVTSVKCSFDPTSLHLFYKHPACVDRPL